VAPIDVGPATPSVDTGSAGGGASADIAPVDVGPSVAAGSGADLLDPGPSEPQDDPPVDLGPATPSTDTVMPERGESRDAAPADGGEASTAEAGRDLPDYSSACVSDISGDEDIAA
jgi:hypothetical protein